MAARKPPQTQTAKTPAKRGRSKPASRAGRPSWPDRFLQHLAAYGAIKPAAVATGIGRATVYVEMERFPDFKADVYRIIDECVEMVEGVLFQMALDPDHTADRIFYLKKRKPEVYADSLNPDQVKQIREQARRDAIGELEGEIARLPKAERALVLAALARSAQRELTP